MSKTLSGSNLFEFIDRIYETAFSDGNWSSWFGELAGTLGGYSGQLSVHSDRPEIVASHTLSPEVLAEYAQHWFREDLWAAGAVRMPVFRSYSDDQLVTMAEFKRSRVYNEFLVPKINGIQHVVGAAFALEQGKLVSFGIHRTAKEGYFTAEDRRRLDVLLPHLRRALLMRERLRDATADRALALESLDRLRHGVFFADAAGKLRFMNAAAENLVRRNTGISVDRGGHLRAATQASQARLSDAISACLAAGTSTQIILPSATGEIALHAIVSSVGRTTKLRSVDGVAAAVIVQDPEDRRRIPEEALRTRYGLTAAEARLVSAMTVDFSVERAAETCGITLNTARTHLKSVYRKLDVEGQGEMFFLLGKDLSGLVR